MFRRGYSVAKDFTFPVVMSRLDIAGKASCSIGTFVVVNRDGWIVTAGHVVQQFSELLKGAHDSIQREGNVAQINADKSLTHKQRAEQLRALGKPKKDATKRGSVYWGVGTGASQAIQAAVLPHADLGIARLDPFDPTWVNSYPVFKDPTRNFEPGVSLCKLGYPLQEIETSYDPQANTFTLLDPLPARFPLEGMYTRNLEIQPPPGEQPFPFPHLWLETSSPGLRGQSGGPIFDVDGTVYAIQCQTQHFKLGFTNKIPEQYLNVGCGVHPVTLFEFLRRHNVMFQISDH